VEHLYEVLEDTVSETILSGISTAYDDPLTEELKWKILNVLVPFVGGERELESCWKRFIIRYLRSASDLKISPHDTMSLYVDYIRWPKGTGTMEQHPQVAGVMDELFVKHSVSVQQLLLARLEPKQELQTPPSMSAAQPVPEPQTTRPRGQEARKARKRNTGRSFHED
jgi:hypothetical protein